MADPFEVRMRFTHQLSHLNASVNAAQKAAHFALKYRDMDEDLHSCILEQLERSNMNNRANIMYFIEHLCDMAQRENALVWVTNIQRDIIRIIDAVAPLDGAGANVKVVRRVLQSLHQKAILSETIMEELDECLKEREEDTALDPPPAPAAAGAAPTSKPTTAPTPTPTSAAPAGGTLAAPRLDKRQIEQRIEEDRERHKRLKEGIWGVGADEDEFQKMWDEISSIGDDDHLAAEEEAMERKRALGEE